MSALGTFRPPRVSMELQSQVPTYCSPGLQRSLELQTNLGEDYAKMYNHGEGPYWGLLLVGSAY